MALPVAKVITTCSSVGPDFAVVTLSSVRGGPVVEWRIGMCNSVWAVYRAMVPPTTHRDVYIYYIEHVTSQQLTDTGIIHGEMKEKTKHCLLYICACML